MPVPQRVEPPGIVSSDATTIIVLMDVSVSDGSCWALLGTYRTTDLRPVGHEGRDVLSAIRLEDAATGRLVWPTRATRGAGTTLGLVEVCFEDVDLAADRMSLVVDGRHIASADGATPPRALTVNSSPGRREFLRILLLGPRRPERPAFVRLAEIAPRRVRLVVDSPAAASATPSPGASPQQVLRDSLRLWPSVTAEVVAEESEPLVSEGSVVHSGLGGRVLTTLSYTSPRPLGPSMVLRVTGTVTTGQSLWTIDTPVDQSDEEGR